MIWIAVLPCLLVAMVALIEVGLHAEGIHDAFLAVLGGIAERWDAR